MNKPTLCLDFDGVIHSYSSGWKGATIIPDPPVPGAVAFILAALESFEVAIYSSRSKEPGGIEAMQRWLAVAYDRHVHPRLSGPPGLEAVDFAAVRLQWPTAKPAAFVTLDDRAVTFTGTWPAVDDLLAFKPWNKHAAPTAPAREIVARALLKHRGFGFYDDPVEGGGDAYDITLNALDEADAVLAALAV